MRQRGTTPATSYDPGHRRRTPLAARIKSRIRAEGQISVADYVTACLGDPDHGYYVHGDPIGAPGDFITAPEISQIFGELIGIWCALVWQQGASPACLNLVELGPGRGTLLKDAIRAMSGLPGLKQAIRVHLVESNTRLQELQSNALNASGIPITHYGASTDLQSVAAGLEGQTILIANEFLDALGVDQWIAQSGAWHRRAVGLDENGELQFIVGPEVSPHLDTIPPGAISNDAVPTATGLSDGTIFERNPCLSNTVAPLLGALQTATPLTALFIDYGHEATAIGETLQAVRQHAYEHPLTSPGEADITAQVDFANAKRAFETAGLTTSSMLTQAEFLGRLGLIERTSRLMSANPGKAAAIEAGALRLMAPNGMGTRFKAMAVSSPAAPPPPIFDAVST